MLHTGQPCALARRDVFDNAPSRAEFFNESPVFKPEPRSGAVEPRAPSCTGHVLAGEASADSIHGKQICRADCLDIIKSLCVWPVAGEHAQAERIALDLPSNGPEPGAFKTEFKAADTGKERANHYCLDTSRNQATPKIQARVKAQKPGSGASARFAATMPATAHFRQRVVKSVLGGVMRYTFSGDHVFLSLTSPLDLWIARGVPCPDATRSPQPLHHPRRPHLAFWPSAGHQTRAALREAQARPLPC